MNIRQDDPLDELCICLHVGSVIGLSFEVSVCIATVHDTLPSVPKHSSLHHSLKSLGSVSLVFHLLISRKCLYCDDIIYSDHLSFYLSFIQDSLYAGQDPIQLYKLSDLRFDLHDALTEHCANYCKIQDSSRFCLHCASFVVIGIKGLLNLGGTDAFNCICSVFFIFPSWSISSLAETTLPLFVFSRPSTLVLLLALCRGRIESASLPSLLLPRAPLQPLPRRQQLVLRSLCSSLLLLD